MCECVPIIDNLLDLLPHDAERAGDVARLELPLRHVHDPLELPPLLLAVFTGSLLLRLLLLVLLLEVVEEVLIQPGAVNLTHLLQMQLHPLIPHDVVLFEPLLHGVIPCPQGGDRALVALGHEVGESSLVDDVLEEILRGVLCRVDVGDVQLLNRVDRLGLVLHVNLREVALALGVLEGGLEVHVVDLVLPQFVLHVVEVIVAHTIRHLQKTGDFQ